MPQVSYADAARRRRRTKAIRRVINPSARPLAGDGYVAGPGQGTRPVAAHGHHAGYLANLIATESGCLTADAAHRCCDHSRPGAQPGQAFRPARSACRRWRARAGSTPSNQAVPDRQAAGCIDHRTLLTRPGSSADSAWFFAFRCQRRPRAQIGSVRVAACKYWPRSLRRPAARSTRARRPARARPAGRARRRPAGRRARYGPGQRRARPCPDVTWSRVRTGGDACGRPIDTVRGAFGAVRSRLRSLGSTSGPSSA